MLIDLSAQRLARLIIRPPFKKGGKCLKRGNCCHYILVPEAKGFLGKLFYFWNTQILGFYRRTSETYESEGKRVYAMGCRYLKKDGACGRYFLRPAVCRKWPMIEYFGFPRILKGCGFKAVNRD
jgi:Fe-S-cluster containining protein